MNTKSIQINEKIFNQIQQYCEKQGISMEYWAEKLFSDYFENVHNCEEPNKELMTQLLNKRIKESENGKFYTSDECKAILSKDFNICI